MSQELIILIFVIVIVTLAILFLRVPAFAILFSLLVGNVLSSELSNEAYGFAASIINISQYQYIQAILLVVPLLLTVLFLRGRTEKSKLVFEILPALFAVVTLILLLYPFLPILKTALDAGLDNEIAQSSGSSLIAMAVVGLISVWISFPKPHKAKHEK